MAKLVNLTGHPLGLPTGHVVPAEGVLDLPEAVLGCADNVPFLAGQRLSGALRIEAETSTPAASTPTSAAPGPVSPIFTTAPDDGASTKG